MNTLSNAIVTIGSMQPIFRFHRTFERLSLIKRFERLERSEAMERLQRSDLLT
jgi:hypothetical protein